MKSKLSTKYKTVDLSYLYGDTEGLDPILAGRLAYLAKVSSKKFKITSGYRPPEEQERLYALYKAGKLKSAARPGTSWHEYHLAADISTYPIRGMSNSELKPYGLCKPISSEGWHIQPIETLGQTDRNKFAPEEVEDLTKEETLALIKEVLTGSGTEPSSWAKEAWNKAKKEGITDGTNPKGYVTREQAVVMLKRKS